MRIARTLFALQAGAHLRQFLAAAHALAVAAPVHVLQFVQKLGGALQAAGDAARLHVSDAFPSFGVAGEVGLVGAFGLHQVAFTPVGAQARIHGEHDALAGVGAQGLNHALGDRRPVRVLAGIGIGQHEDEIGIGAEIELTHAQPSQGDHHHLVIRAI